MICGMAYDREPEGDIPIAELVEAELSTRKASREPALPPDQGNWLDTQILNRTYQLGTSVGVDPLIFAFPREMPEGSSRILGSFGCRRIRADHSCPDIIDHQLILGTINPLQVHFVGVDVISGDQLSECRDVLV